MKVRVSHTLASLSIGTVLALAPLATSAQDAPGMGGMKSGGGMSQGDDMMGGQMGGGMKGGMSQGDMMGGPMGGGMKGGMPQGDMSHMMSMMRDRLAHAGDRVAALKTQLKITEAQTPAWNKFADALLASAKSMEQSMDEMHHKMQSGAPPSLPERLDHDAKMASGHVTNLQAIKAALDPLYASFSDEQKKVADGLRVGPMGLM
ncbi:MAG TPA: Spy/CpxP family protein refolding chaperone [Methylocella sp.]|nr:Spy/CpxP family protein refolding chaperone [Methylocella sp.]